MASWIDKADKYELLYNFPTELPTTHQYDIPYADSWYAGWDECFPAVAGGPYKGHPYNGVMVPDHGELWGLPTTAVPTRDGITTVWHGLRFGYRLTRKLYLDGPAVVAEYTLVNLAPFEFRFVWALHALMSMTSPAELSMPQGLPMRIRRHKRGVETFDEFAWPGVREIDFSRINAVPRGGGWKLTSTQPISNPVGIHYPQRGRGINVSYEAGENGPAAHWGIWLNLSGSGDIHFAVEPTTGRHDGVDMSVDDGSAGRIEPMGKAQWSVRFDLFSL